MKKLLFLALAALAFTTGVEAQTLKKVTELKMPKTADDDMPGTRGAAVVWHPVYKKYYASFAGNVAFPMGIFDATGKRVSDDELVTQADTRGLWYNPATKEIWGNGYSEFGWFKYKTDSKGNITEAINVLEGMYQPNEQCVGAYDPVAKKVLFLAGGTVYRYNNEGEQTDSVIIRWNRTKKDGIDEDQDTELTPEDYNPVSMVFTGIKGQELGFLNVTNKEVELYDAKTGFLAKKLALPDNAPVEVMFGFSYANGMYWIFNQELRKWIGYK
ncbi:hypothetical protein JMG10_14805 [Nostoc ellipsosporum NOK]|nr:hypothetical protein [Nostoc ellipsosporum NOK]